jgi:hypothetical protein
LVIGKRSSIYHLNEVIWNYFLNFINVVWYILDWYSLFHYAHPALSKSAYNSSVFFPPVPCTPTKRYIICKTNIFFDIAIIYFHHFLSSSFLYLSVVTLSTSEPFSDPIFPKKKFSPFFIFKNKLTLFLKIIIIENQMCIKFIISLFPHLVIPISMFGYIF